MLAVGIHELAQSSSTARHCHTLLLQLCFPGFLDFALLVSERFAQVLVTQHVASGECLGFGAGLRQGHRLTLLVIAGQGDTLLLARGVRVAIVINASFASQFANLEGAFAFWPVFGQPAIR